VSASEEFGLERLTRAPVITRILSQPDGKQTLDLIRATVAKGCTDAEIGHFLELCAAYELDPFAREAWCAKSNTGNLLIMVGRDGLRKVVQRNGSEMEGDVVHANDTFSYGRRARTSPRTRRRRSAPVRGPARVRAGGTWTRSLLPASST
jgi:hypothetical protein